MQKQIQDIIVQIKNLDMITISAIAGVLFVIIIVVVFAGKSKKKKIKKKKKVQHGDTAVESVPEMKTRSSSRNSVKVSREEDLPPPDLEEALKLDTEPLKPAAGDSTPSASAYRILTVEGNDKEKKIKELINILNEGIYNMENQEMEIFINTHIKVDKVTEFNEKATSIFKLEPSNYIKIQEFAKWLNDISLDIYSKQDILTLLVPKIKKFRELLEQALENNGDFNF